MKFFSTIALFAVAALAAPVDLEVEAREIELEKRAPTTCGNNYYSYNQVQNAVNAACNTQAGNYPHQYNNYEGFSFPNPSPWYEFPIKESGVYTGGSPGADRVIIDSNCNYQGSITHTGASGNNFVACSDTQ
ncbi:hypothetical protein AMS68_000761 [Peltaster fructicola]|uniref:ribonuclease T1 n=1 Tax=Peltaster fructicola TaxID=286661 RepID=A0A6H0XKI6_9PEZI|nr:hypothetical protein AMS68_000761 [Peltaster fructicola]